MVHNHMSLGSTKKYVQMNSTMTTPPEMFNVSLKQVFLHFHLSIKNYIGATDHSTMSLSASMTQAVLTLYFLVEFANERHDSGVHCFSI